MAKKKMEESTVDNLQTGFTVDDTEPLEMTEIPKEEIEITERVTPKKPIKVTDSTVSCLRNKRVIVRHIPKQTGMVSNPRHLLYGGMAENATRTFVVPKLSSGMLVNVLTDKEKSFLEEIMGLEYNALSIYKKKDNFWDDSNENGISSVRLTKQDNFLDLSNPEDYIRYKILLSNRDYIAPSMRVLEDTPKATYQFVIIEEGEEDKVAQDNMSTTMKCYKEFGKIEEDIDTLKMIVEILDGRPVSANVKLPFLKTKINGLIQGNSKMFLHVVSDPLLSTKVFIRKCVENRIISDRGNFLYIAKDNTPLCENGQEPTLNTAAVFLNSPKNQDIKFMLESYLNQKTK